MAFNFLFNRQSLCIKFLKECTPLEIRVPFKSTKTKDNYMYSDHYYFWITKILEKSKRSRHLLFLRTRLKVRLHATILSGRFWQIICARSSTYRDLNVSLKPSALSSVYIIVFCVQKVFKNFTTQEKSLNREKNLWFVYRFFSRFFES